MPAKVCPSCRLPAELLICDAAGCTTKRCEPCDDALADGMLTCQLCEAQICEEHQSRCSRCKIAVCDDDLELLLNCEGPGCEAKVCLMCVMAKNTCGTCGFSFGKGHRKQAKRGLEAVSRRIEESSPADILHDEPLPTANGTASSSVTDSDASAASAQEALAARAAAQRAEVQAAQQRELERQQTELQLTEELAAAQRANEDRVRKSMQAAAEEEKRRAQFEAELLSAEEAAERFSKKARNAAKKERKKAAQKEAEAESARQAQERHARQREAAAAAEAHERKRVAEDRAIAERRAQQNEAELLRLQMREVEQARAVAAAAALEEHSNDHDEEDPDESVAVYPHCTIEQLTEWAHKASRGSSGAVDADDIRLYFCGSGTLPSDVVDDILYEVVEVSGGSLADGVRACASMVGLDLSAAAVAAAIAANIAASSSRQQNGHSRAAAAAAADYVGAADESDDDVQEDSPLHRKFREKLASGACSERDLTSMADQLKGREGFAKLKKLIKKQLKGIREEREAARYSSAHAPAGAGAAAAAANGHGRGSSSSSSSSSSGAVLSAKEMQYHHLLQHLAVQPDLVLEIAHNMCGWFIGKDGSRLKEMQTQTGATRIWVQQHLADGSVMPEGAARLLCISGARNAVLRASAVAQDIMKGAPRNSAPHSSSQALAAKPPAAAVRTVGGSTAPPAPAPIVRNPAQCGTFCYGALPPLRSGSGKDLVTKRLECPRTHVKLLLGKRGRTMQRLLEEMGPVQLALDEKSGPEGSPCPLLVRGPAALIENAVARVNEVIAVPAAGLHVRDARGNILEMRCSLSYASYAQHHQDSPAAAAPAPAITAVSAAPQRPKGGKQQRSPAVQQQLGSAGSGSSAGFATESFELTESAKGMIGKLAGGQSGPGSNGAAAAAAAAARAAEVAAAAEAASAAAAAAAAEAEAAREEREQQQQRQQQQEEQAERERQQQAARLQQQQQHQLEQQRLQQQQLREQQRLHNEAMLLQQRQQQEEAAAAAQAQAQAQAAAAAAAAQQSAALPTWFTASNQRSDAFSYEPALPLAPQQHAARPTNRESELAAFLAQCGQSEYLPLLLEHEMFLDVLVIMDEADFREINMPKGPYLVIKAALKSSGSESVAESVAAAALDGGGQPEHGSIGVSAAAAAPVLKPGERLCVVCEAHAADVVLLPCQCMKICHGCSVTQTGSQIKTCPHCKKKVKQARRVYR